MSATSQVPVVAYLDIRDPDKPTIRGSRCRTCGSVYLLRRSGCGKCGEDDFQTDVDLGSAGTVTTATTVHRGMPGVPTPFTSAVVALDEGGYIRCTLDGAEDPVAAVRRRAHLWTAPIGTDPEGTEAVGFTFIVDWEM